MIYQINEICSRPTTNSMEEANGHGNVHSGTDGHVGLHGTHLQGRALNSVIAHEGNGVLPNGEGEEASDTVKTPYVLTDKVILGLIHEALKTSGFQQMRYLQVYCHRGRVTLQGSLPSCFLKQTAQTIVRSVAGVRDIDNDVRVVSSW